jgi:small-conductance mechanosensitive channel
LTEQRCNSGCDLREFTTRDKTLVTDITATISRLRARLELVEARLQQFQRMPETDESRQWAENIAAAQDLPSGFSSVEPLTELVH